MKTFLPVRLTALTLAVGMSSHTLAANPAFQTTVSNANICPAFSSSPVCTSGSALSDASQDSLAPTQALASNEGSLEQARKQAQGKASGGKLNIGPFSLLLNSRGSWFERDPSAQERGYDGNAYSVQLGLDKRLSPATVVGGFLVYERSRAEFGRDPAGLSAESSEGKTHSDTFSIVAFGAHNLSDALYIEGAAGYGIIDYELNRSVYYQPVTGGAITPVTTEGKTDGKNYWMSLGGGYELASGASSLVPYARLTYARSTVDGYSENELTATGFAIRYSEARRSSLTSTLGIRAGMTQSYAWGVLAPFVKLEYEHEFKNDPQKISMTLVVSPSSTPFTPPGQQPDRNYFHLGGGAQFIMPNGWISFFELEALLGQRDLDRTRLFIGLRKEL